MSTSNTNQASTSSSLRLTGNHRGGSTVAADILQWILQDLDFLEESFEAARRSIDRVTVQINEARTTLEFLRGGGSESELTSLKKKVSKLKFKIPFNLINPTFEDQQESNPQINLNRRSISSITTTHDVQPPDERLRYFTRNPALHDVTYRTKLLEWTTRFPNLTKNCLLCFLIFPENAVIKKSTLLYWVRANNISVHDLKRVFDGTVNDLIDKCFIKPVNKNYSLTASGYWMDPLVRSLISGTNWNLDPQVMKERYHVHSLNEDDVIYSEWSQISSTKNHKILHLGKWQKLARHHIEFDNVALIFKGVASMNKLRYISFRGISMINELPKFITKSERLAILDVKACHDLETIPSDINYLWRTLTHLDMSECYLVDKMPKALAGLCFLQVLKGFVVGNKEEEGEDSCTLKDLSSFKYLVKLNIYTSVKEFPDEGQLTDLQNMEALRNLTISWGGCSIQRDAPITTKGLSAHKDSTSRHQLFSFNLEKLDLQCVPNTIISSWLKPPNFKNLKKLYIRGGSICDLGQLSENWRKNENVAKEEAQWDVELLRLKHLNKLRIDWSELRLLFPKMMCLEKVECPNLTSYPGDENGLWMNTSHHNHMKVTRLKNQLYIK